MMRQNMILTTMAILGLAVCAYGQNEEEERGCTNQTLKGPYGVHGTGVRPTQFVAPGRTGVVGAPEQVESIVVRVFDGKGNFTQSESSKGTSTSYIPDRPGSGTYVVTPDCTVITTIQVAPGITAVTRALILDGGKEIRGFTVSPEHANLRFVGRRIK